MQLCLIGADFEENLGIGLIAAAAEDAGHRPSIVAFNHVGEIATVVRAVMDRAPDVVGLSIQFQHRVYEFLALARRLRAAGYEGHITCGGQSRRWRGTTRSIRSTASTPWSSTRGNAPSSICSTRSRAVARSPKCPASPCVPTTACRCARPGASW